MFPKEQDPFWSLPEVSKKSYSPPENQRGTDTIPVTMAEGNDSPTEKIPPRTPDTAAPTRPTRPADRTFRTVAYSTAQEYKHRTQADPLGFGEQEYVGLSAFPDDTPNDGDVIVDRTGGGWLLEKVTVRRWINDFSFYAAFGRDAMVSHNKVAVPCEPVSYSSFVPQYSQMNSRQLAYYLWFRDNARNGNYLPADFAYVLLYIYEILNLPQVIEPSEGIQLLCQLWAQYRQTYPKLDAYLCEWIPDYALIHGVTLPGSIEPFLSAIVRKAQFKEFFLDNMCPPGGQLGHKAMSILAEVLLGAYADYDYTLSRYYTGGNQAAYDKCIPEALTLALEKAYADHRGMFATDRIYRLTRDSYCGAVIHTGNKRRIDVAFHSCIRSPDTRRFVTSIVKYAENRLRSRLKIKSKLNANEIAPEDKAQVDAYFGPEELSTSKKKAVEEEAYLKLYDAETTGFDFSAAREIENASWANTDRLTAAEQDSTTDADTAISMHEPAEISTEMVPDTPTTTMETDTSIGETNETSPVSPEENLLRAAVVALLEGEFEGYCRAHGKFPGRMAEQINEVFLDVTGDILIEVDGSHYNLIEDYRKDAEAWSKTQM